MKKTILVVDDNSVMRRILETTLRKEYLVIQADNAVDAQKMIDIHLPDAVILDILMPGPINGLELCSSIKSTPRFASTFVILATSSWEIISDNCGKNHADAFFIKPFKTIDILEKLHLGLRNGRSTQIINQ